MWESRRSVKEWSSAVIGPRAVCTVTFIIRCTAARASLSDPGGTGGDELPSSELGLAIFLPGVSEEQSISSQDGSSGKCSFKRVRTGLVLRSWYSGALLWACTPAPSHRSIYNKEYL